MEGRPYSTVLRDLFSQFYALIRSEIHLAKAEIKENVKDVGKHSARTVVFAVMAGLGVLCLLAFAIIGLGELLGDRYWLSALIVGLALAVPGALLAIRSAKHISVDASLPYTRESLQGDTEAVQRRVHDIREGVSAARNGGAQPSSEINRRVS